MSLPFQRRYDVSVAPKRPVHATSSLPIVTRFRVGNHEVQVSKDEGRWAVTVDGVALSNWFMTQAEAWEAGVREVDRLERPGGPVKT